jgi:hypothetical protein
MATVSTHCKHHRHIRAAATATALLIGLAIATDRAAGADAADAPLYVCVRNVDGVRQQSDIALEPSVDKLCRKAPEMGPCQYEREACRRRGGRVYTSTGQEITRDTEAEYNRRVMRVRMKSS